MRIRRRQSAPFLDPRRVFKGRLLAFVVILLVINMPSVPLWLWKVISVLGVSFIAIGIAAGYVDVATRFEFDFISRDFGIFILAILVGIVLAFVGPIGWARTLGLGGTREHRGLSLRPLG